MIDVENQRIDPNLGERRERIATAILAQLIGRDADFREEQVTSRAQSGGCIDPSTGFWRSLTKMLGSVGVRF